MTSDEIQFDAEERISPKSRFTKEYKERPPVIRFAQFSGEPSKQLGRTDAARVFASNLAEVWDMSVENALDLSGYNFTPASDDKFYIWIFVPSDNRQVVPATWGRVLDDLPKWLSDPMGKAP